MGDRGHGQTEYYDRTAANVRALLENSNYHKGPRDEQVRFLFICDMLVTLH
jgi:hypothetical protein